jgi:hypothetical protein
MLHRTLDGNWASCAQESSCELLFHLPNFSVEEMTDMPFEPMLQLLNAIQPPYMSGEGVQWWFQNEDGKLQTHRDYDLPAVVHNTGYMEWWQHGKMHRDRDLPAVISPTGIMDWYQHGKRVKRMVDGRMRYTKSGGVREES